MSALDVKQERKEFDDWADDNGFNAHRNYLFECWLAAKRAALSAAEPVVGTSPSRPFKSDAEREALEYFTRNPSAALRALHQELGGANFCSALDMTATPLAPAVAAVPLSDEQIAKAIVMGVSDPLELMRLPKELLLTFVRAIEAAHGIDATATVMRSAVK